MDEAARRLKQLLEHGHYPVEETVCPIARCPDCGHLFSIWDMSNAHVKGTPYYERRMACDDCYEEGNQYDSRWLTIHRAEQSDASRT